MFDEEINVAVLGFGTVGEGVYQLLEKRFDGFGPTVNLSKVYVREKRIDELTKKYPTVEFTSNINDIIDDDKIDIVIECMGGIDDAYEFMIKSLKSGKNFITSNKEVMATYYSKIKDEIDNTYSNIAYEASVCGGIPIFHILYDLKRSDTIYGYMAIINGTTNYILSKMTENTLTFEEALNDAKKLGFAERDPSKDIEGIDPKYKALLLSNFIFEKSYYLDEIINFGIKNITKKDIEFATMNDKVIKLIAFSDINNIFVMPMMIDEKDTFSNVNENLNAVLLYSENLKESYYIGPGAGTFRTANSVILDIKDMINDEYKFIDTYVEKHISNDFVSKYYISGKSINNLSDIKESTIDKNTITTVEMSVKELYNKVKEFEDLFICKI